MWPSVAVCPTVLHAMIGLSFRLGGPKIEYNHTPSDFFCRRRGMQVHTAELTSENTYLRFSLKLLGVLGPPLQELPSIHLHLALPPLAPPSPLRYRR